MAEIDTGGRERILQRIRTALRQQAPLHGLGTERGPIFPPVVNALERFQAECKANLTELILTTDADSTMRAVAEVLASLPLGQIFVQDAPALRALATAWKEGRTVRWSSEGPPPEASQATITLAEQLVAATGSILVSAAGCGGRAASVVAPCHIVVATEEQLVPDLESALAAAQERSLAVDNSYLCLITGSSRTADIEKILVMGAHGPRRLELVLQRE